MNVDKPWGPIKSLSIDHQSGLLYRNMRFNRRNFLPRDGHIGCKPSPHSVPSITVPFLDQKDQTFLPSLNLLLPDLFRRLRSMRPTPHQHAGLRFTSTQTLSYHNFPLA